MVDIFGINKVEAMATIQEITCGVTRGLLEGYEYKLEEKQREINKLKEQETDKKEEYKKLYNEMLQTIEEKYNVNEKKEMDALILTLFDIISHDSTLNINRVISHIKKEYNIILNKNMINNIMYKAKENLR